MSFKSKARKSYKSVDDIFSSDKFGLFDDVRSESKSNTARSTAQANFEAINEFLDSNNRKPSPSGPLAEKMLAARLKSYRENPTDEVIELDRYGLLDGFLKQDPIPSLDVLENSTGATPLQTSQVVVDIKTSAEDMTDKSLEVGGIGNTLVPCENEGSENTALGKRNTASEPEPSRDIKPNEGLHDNACQPENKGDVKAVDDESASAISGQAADVYNHRNEKGLFSDSRWSWNNSPYNPDEADSEKEVCEHKSGMGEGLDASKAATTLQENSKNNLESFALEAQSPSSKADPQLKEKPKTLDDLLGRMEGLGLMDDVRSDIFEIPDELSVLRTRTVSDDDVIGKRDVCLDFDEYASIFNFISKAMADGAYTRHDFVREKSIHIGSVFIISGLTAYVADKYYAEDREDKKRRNERLRLIFSNGTESNILAFSLTTAQYKDYASEFYQVEITDPEWIDLHFSEGFAGKHVDVKKISDSAAQKISDDDKGDYIYVAKLVEKPDVLFNYSDLYKIGMTKVGSKARTKNSKNDPTFLHRDVEVVGLWQIKNANIYKVESFMHKFFNQANVDMNVVTKESKIHGAREWFDVPISEISKAINLIVDGDVTKYYYDHQDKRIKPKE